MTTTTNGSPSSEFDLMAAIASVASSAMTSLGMNTVTDTSPAMTRDNAPSTPWTSFAAGVNVVSGNLVLQAADLSVGSVGFGTSIGRTYTSAAADRTGVFGVGWYWSYGVRV